jgi:hypothetical protein
MQNHSRSTTYDARRDSVDHQCPSISPDGNDGIGEVRCSLYRGHEGRHTWLGAGGGCTWLSEQEEQDRRWGWEWDALDEELCAIAVRWIKQHPGDVRDGPGGESVVAPNPGVGWLSRVERAWFVAHHRVWTF